MRIRRSWNSRIASSLTNSFRRPGCCPQRLTLSYFFTRWHWFGSRGLERVDCDVSCETAAGRSSKHAFVLPPNAHVVRAFAQLSPDQHLTRFVAINRDPRLSNLWVRTPPVPHQFDVTVLHGALRGCQLGIYRDTHAAHRLRDIKVPGDEGVATAAPVNRQRALEAVGAEPGSYGGFLLSTNCFRFHGDPSVPVAVRNGPYSMVMESAKKSNPG